LAGEHIGQPSSREIVVIPGADAVHLSEGKMELRWKVGDGMRRAA